MNGAGPFSSVVVHVGHSASSPSCDRGLNWLKKKKDPSSEQQDGVQTMDCVQNIAQLLGGVHGIVIQRAALGLHTPVEHTAMLQKKLLQYCNVNGKLVLLTDVMDSMQV